MWYLKNKTKKINSWEQREDWWLHWWDMGEMGEGGQRV